MAPMTEETADGSSQAGPHERHARLLAREALAAALYMALVLLAGLVALPVVRIPDDKVMVATLVGTAIGLVLAHWFAFRLAAHVTAEGGTWPGSAAQEATAQIVGGLSVALVASIPFLLTDGASAVRLALLLLSALPAATGFMIARLRGFSWLRSGGTAAVVFLIALVVVEVKAAVGH